MAEKFMGPFPVYNTVFKVETAPSVFNEIADIESFSISIDGKVESWTPFTTKGWERSLMTGKKLTVQCKGKRNIGDTGNDFIASTAFKDGLECATKVQIEFPDKAKLEFKAIVNVTSIVGGDSTNVAPLEFDLVCDGRPTYTEGTV